MSGGCQPERMPKRMPEPMLGRMPERMPDRLSEYMSDKMPTRMPDGMSECVPERMPDRMSEYMSDRMRDIMSAYMPGRISVGFSWDHSKKVILFFERLQISTYMFLVISAHFRCTITFLPQGKLC